MTHEFNFTFSEVIQLLIFLGGIVGVWVVVRIKLTRLERDLKSIDTDNALRIEGLRKETNLTIEGLRMEVDLKIDGVRKEIALNIEGLRKEVDLKIKHIDVTAGGLAEHLSEKLKDFVSDNKEDHNSIKVDVKEIKTALGDIKNQIKNH